jgi:DNA modification methylase
MKHVHGFHSYPARLHPETAGRLIEAFSPAGASVLDPFCGSGTVLVEALIRGRRGHGVDANPLAIELSWLKTRAAHARWLGTIEDSAKAVAVHADARRTDRSGSTRRYGGQDLALFAPHVLLELDGLRDGISRVSSPEQARALALVLSAILTKVSRRGGDASTRTGTKRIASGYTIKLFARKATELVRRVHEFEALLPERPPAVKLELGDARRLGSVRPGSIDLVLSSPPYAGVYDYYEHHKLRFRWLGLEARGFEQSEMGSRRQARSAKPDQALADFSRDLAACLREIGRCLAIGGRAALVVADSVLGGRALYADDLVGQLAPPAGLKVLARAAQIRPHFHTPTRDAFQHRPRAEHLILLSRDAKAKERLPTPGRPSHDRPTGGRGR